MEHLTSINRQITAVISHEDTDPQTSVDSKGFVWLQYGNSDVLIVWSVIQHFRFAHTAKCQSLTHIKWKFCKAKMTSNIILKKDYEAR